MLEYQEQFEELLNRVDLPEDYATSYFLSGLKTEIQLAVRMFMPKTLQHARTLAKPEEAKMLTQQRKGVIKTGFHSNMEDRWRGEKNYEASWKKENNFVRNWRRDG